MHMLLKCIPEVNALYATIGPPEVIMSYFQACLILELLPRSCGHCMYYCTEITSMLRIQ